MTRLAKAERKRLVSPQSRRVAEMFIGRERTFLLLRSSRSHEIFETICSQV